MFTPRAIAALCALLLLLAACGNDTAPTVDDNRVVDNPTEKSDDPSSGKNGGDKQDKKGDDAASGGTKKGGTKRDPVQKPTGSKGSNEPQDNKTGGGGRAPSDGASHPAAGDYTYSQAGYEEFCQSASCDRSSLPPKQNVNISVKGSDQAATVIVEAHPSKRSSTRTTYRFDDTAARVTKFEVTFNMSGFEYTDSYEPRPPVRAMTFPLKVGSGWGGTWESSVSGKYRVEVLAKERVTVAGKAIDAFKVSFSSDFRGDFKGHNDMTLWVDGRNYTLLAARGFMEAESQLGKYETRYSTKLTSGPGY